MLLLTVLFIVFFVLWLASLLPAANTRIGVYGGFLPWLCVGLLALRLGLFSGLH
jgi:hypothetical protein